jgi:ferredoxin
MMTPSSFDEERTGLRHISPGTNVKVTVAVGITILMAVASGVWTVARFTQGIEFEQKAQRSLIGDLPKRSDLDALERRMTATLQKQMKKAILQCPRDAVRRGTGTWMECRVIFAGAKDDEE